MISRTAEYAVRAALWLAHQPERACTVRQIASATGVPAGYLAKILQALGKAGILRAQPGPGGGFVLSQPPQALHVIDVINAIGPLRRIEQCPLGLPEHQTELCPFHERLDRAIAMVNTVFAGCTLADLLDESRSRGLHCARVAPGGCAQGASSAPTRPEGTGTSGLPEGQTAPQAKG